MKFHNISLDECQITKPEEFPTFNEFFYRKLRPDARVIAAQDDPTIAVSPADCRLHVFETLERAKEIWIKGRNFGLSQLLKDPALEKEFNSCSVLIARLAPQDYHRFHFPITCRLAQRRDPQGSCYYTVNPVAVRNVIDVYSENKRVLSVLESKEFGRVLFIAIGATMVGSINFTVNVGANVKKGSEYGYFAFGGSTILLLFSKGKIKFDEDLILNSSKQLETLVKMGESVGKVIS
eukprot:TRINITY_DN2983_c0_g2_i1.p1 TRINITY_DN2983_c0_g2~~TRINITY_DN2983_c0_g2_i1.p1  ORF type:complete len:236 (+),score=30.98 TRINITY_DN2983_c0_g2_i1:1-708(+)